MKKPLLAFCLICLFFTSFTALYAQQSFRTTTKTVIGFLEYLPADYHKNSDKYPVVIFLHGIGERGPNSTDPAVLETGKDLLAKLGPPKYAKSGTQFPFILISPQLKNSYGNWPTWYVMEVLDYVKTYLRVDERRIHITGLSLGGGGTWTMAQDFPKLFASVAPVCGGYNSPSKACGIASENLPIWTFHGDADTTVPLSKTTNMVNAINACTPTPNPLAKVSIYSGVKHNAWDRAYLPDYTYHKPNVYEWMMSYTNTVNGNNKIPVASAGSDKISTAKTFTLYGAGSDSDGSIASYAWTKISGPSCSMSNTTTSALSLSGLNPGNYMFKLTVKDNSGDIDSDYVKLTIHNAPVANAGPDVTITLPTSSVSVTGSGTDKDGTIASYRWTFISGPKTPTLTNATTPTVTASSLSVAGNYVLQLEVKDNLGAVGKDQMTITVRENLSASTNIAPMANAGKDLTITLPTSSVSIAGSGTDADGTISSYRWTFRSGPKTPVLTNATSATVKTSDMTIAGNYTFRLEVKDNAGATGIDDVIVTVKEANILPVANAGKDLAITLPTSSISIAGTATDADGTISSYKWTFRAGPKTPVLTNASTATVTISDLTIAGSYTFRLEVKDNAGGIGIDDVIVTVGMANILPVANAGKDLTITLPTSSISITGSGTDADGTISSYRWTFRAGPKTPMLTNASTATVTISDLTVAGSYTFRLEVKDNAGGIGRDEVILTVGEANIQPVANAGKDLTITLPTSSISITGTGTDADGTIASYRWTFRSGPKTPALTNASSAKVTISDLTVVGNYTFRLEVKDNAGGIGRDEVIVTVLDGSGTNLLPTAYAGKDLTIYLPTNSVTITGTASDPDGAIVSYAWSQISGPAKASLSGSSTNKLTASSMNVTGFYVFKLTVKDNAGAIAEDKVGVTVSDGSSSIASIDANLVLPEERKADLADDSDAYWRDKMVIIYSETGAQLYAGKWYADSYKSIFQKGGFYVYAVMEGTKRVGSGKIFVTR